MRYRRFGRTELSMPVFSCGGMRYQHRWQDLDPAEIPAEGQANLEATILRALELGINHFETARGYGSSEMQLGWVLPKLPRERILVQTKIAPTEDPADFQERFEKSVRYLGVEYLDLLGFHGVNNPQTLEWTVRKGGCLDAVRRLQREGRVRFVGFSTHAPCRWIVDAIETGEFDYVNLHWYLVNPLTWPAVEAASRQDMGVFIISPSDKGGRLQDPPDRLRQLCAPSLATSQDSGPNLTPMKFNDLYCLSRPEVSTLSIGAERPADFDEHVTALEHYDRAAGVVAPIEARIRDEMASALGADWVDGWWKGIPDYDRIPGEVNLLEILRLWTYAKSLGLVEWAKSRYNLMSTNSHWTPGNHAGELDEEAIKRACAGSAFVDRLPAILREAHAMLYTEPEKRLSEG